MEILREEGKTSSPKFDSLHHQSEWVYRTEATLLLVSGIPLFIALRRPMVPPVPPAKA
jgi:hypothetical protein